MFNLASPLVGQFRHKPSAHLARKIWAKCHHHNFEVPEDVMEFFVEEIHKQIRQEEVKLSPEMKVHRERMGEILMAIINAENLGENRTRVSFFKQFAEEWKTPDEESGRLGWEVVQQKYKDFVRGH